MGREREGLATHIRGRPIPYFCFGAADLDQRLGTRVVLRGATLRRCRSVKRFRRRTVWIPLRTNLLQLQNRATTHDYDNK